MNDLEAVRFFILLLSDEWMRINPAKDTKVILWILIPALT